VRVRGAARGVDPDELADGAVGAASDGGTARSTTGGEAVDTAATGALPQAESSGSSANATHRLTGENDTVPGEVPDRPDQSLIRSTTLPVFRHVST